MVVPATAPVDRAAEQLSRSQAGQPHALAAQVRLVGVPDLGNVSTGRLVRNNEVVAAINAAVPGADVALPEGRDPHRPPDNYLDTTRLREDAGFRPEYDVERAVPDYVGWLRRHDR